MDLRKKAEELAARPYSINVIRDLTTEGQPVFLALSPELEGCIGQGESKDAAILDLKRAQVDYIQSLLEDGLPIPEPQSYPTCTTSGTTSTQISYKQSGRWSVIKSDPDASRVTHLIGSSSGI